MKINILDTPSTRDPDAANIAQDIISSLDWEMRAYSSDTKICHFVGKDADGIARLELDIQADEPKPAPSSSDISWENATCMLK